MILFTIIILDVPLDHHWPSSSSRAFIPYYHYVIHHDSLSLRHLSPWWEGVLIIVYLTLSYAIPVRGQGAAVTYFEWLSRLPRYQYYPVIDYTLYFAAEYTFHASTFLNYIHIPIAWLSIYHIELEQSSLYTWYTFSFINILSQAIGI
jgi:hypothetical protein